MNAIQIICMEIMTVSTVTHVQAIMEKLNCGDEKKLAIFNVTMHV